MHRETAASKDADMPPTTPDTSWLILQRLDDVRREQDRLYNYIEQRADRIEQRIDRLEQRLDRLTGWFIAGLIAVLGALAGVAVAGRL
ncbi:hypothetical protein [Thermaerobacter subterraneus]|uniref:Hemolysin XhlA n=1 Tax=Thermaerobacter subterraneus DSM 13965 TaxID=867903 RepID=K6Q1Y4_9FIRM|nr:hypothetical protein [Thermaerobacter subterraneus]EKP95198.1 hypothetical protein ThesuDRAFT_00938 [Thermaerobacter subterraneus DSM 13965]